MRASDVLVARGEGPYDPSRPLWDVWQGSTVHRELETVRARTSVLGMDDGAPAALREEADRFLMVFHRSLGLTADGRERCGPPAPLPELAKLAHVRRSLLAALRRPAHVSTFWVRAEVAETLAKTGGGADASLLDETLEAVRAGVKHWTTLDLVSAAAVAERWHRPATQGRSHEIARALLPEMRLRQAVGDLNGVDAEVLEGWVSATRALLGRAHRTSDRSDHLGGLSLDDVARDWADRTAAALYACSFVAVPERLLEVADGYQLALLVLPGHALEQLRLEMVRVALTSVTTHETLWIGARLLEAAHAPADVIDTYLLDAAEVAERAVEEGHSECLPEMLNAFPSWGRVGKRVTRAHRGALLLLRDRAAKKILEDNGSLAVVSSGTGDANGHWGVEDDVWLRYLAPLSNAARVAPEAVTEVPFLSGDARDNLRAMIATAAPQRLNEAAVRHLRWAMRASVMCPSHVVEVFDAVVEDLGRYGFELPPDLAHMASRLAVEEFGQDIPDEVRDGLLRHGVTGKVLAASRHYAREPRFALPER